MTSVGTDPRAWVRSALSEDLGADGIDLGVGDITSRHAIDAGVRGRARLFAKSRGVLAGVQCAVDSFLLLDPDAEIELCLRDGDAFAPGDDVLRVAGGVHAILAAERTALNFLQRLSGVATRTREFVERVAGTGARIFDTRKTTPGLRQLEKAAVVAGGGCNHRIGLFDQVLLKENHFAFAAPVTYEEVVRRCRDACDRPVVAEARDLDEALAAVRGGAGVVLLDNFDAGEPLRTAVAAVREEAGRLGRAVETEASGGITLDTVRAFAECGVDRISVGSLTHSAPAVDLSLLVEERS